jgi:hypothetical protein
MAKGNLAPRLNIIANVVLYAKNNADAIRFANAVGDWGGNWGKHFGIGGYSSGRDGESDGNLRL